MRKITRLRYNVKTQDGQPLEVNLGAVNVVKSPSRVGKTGLVQALSLLLCGFADDVQGRDDVRSLEMLISMGPLRGEIGDRMFVEGFADDGTSAKYEITRDTDGVVRVVTDTAKEVWGSEQHPLTVETVFALRSVERVLLSDDATIRGQILQWSATGLSRKDVLNIMPTAYHARYVELAGSLGKGETSIEELRRVEKLAKKRAAESRSSANAAKALVTAKGGAMQAPRPTDAELTEARQAAAAAKAALEAAALAAGGAAAQAANGITAEDHVARETSLLTRIAEAESSVQTNTALLAQWRDYATQIPGPPNLAWYDENIDALTHLHAVLDMLVRREAEFCPIDNSPLNAAALGAQREAVASGILNVQRQRAEAASGDPNAAARQQAATTIAGLEGAIATARNAAATASVEIAQLPPIRVASPLQDALAEARAASDLADNRLKDLERRETEGAATAQSRSTSDAMARDADDWTALKQACIDTVKQLLPRCVKAFEAQVQRYLPDDMQFGVLAEDDKPARIGLWKDGTSPDGTSTPRRFLDIATSGAEWTAVCMAIAISTTTDAMGPVWFTPVRERDVSDDVLAAMVRAVRNVKYGQVLTTTTSKPKGRLANVTIIDIDEIYKARAPAAATPPPVVGAAAPFLPAGGAAPLASAAPPPLAAVPPASAPVGAPPPMLPAAPPPTVPVAQAVSPGVPAGMPAFGAPPDPGFPPGPPIAPPTPPTPIVVAPPVVAVAAPTIPAAPPAIAPAGPVVPPTTAAVLPPASPIPTAPASGQQPIDPRSALAERLRMLGWTDAQMAGMTLVDGVRAQVHNLSPEAYCIRYPLVGGGNGGAGPVVPIAEID